MSWMFVRQDPAQNMLFGYKLADETRRQFHLKLWNIYNFFITYSNLDGFVPTSHKSLITNHSHVLDKWILIRLNQTILEVTKCLEKFDPYNSSSAIDKFVDDLSVWYLRRSRDRRNRDFYQTTYYVLLTTSKLLAPFIPFLAETIYVNLTKNESVHLETWPECPDLTKEDLDLSITPELKEEADTRDLIRKIQATRKELGVHINHKVKLTAPWLPSNQKL